MAIINLNESQSGQSDNLLDALAAELRHILARDEINRQKTTRLMEQIGFYEARREYVQLARAQGESIAQGITDSAAERVRAINENAYLVVRPQQEQLVDLEKEIGVLSPAVNQPAKVPEYSTGPLMEMGNVRREYSLAEPEDKEGNDTESELDTVAMEQAEPEQTDPNQTVIIKREYSLREPQEPDSAADNQALFPSEKLLPDPQGVKREYSLREPQDLDGGGIITAAADQFAIAPPGQVKREFSLREPQLLELPADNPEIRPPEQDESRMWLDAFVDPRNYDNVAGQSGPIHNHSWQIKIEVEIPVNTHVYTSYGKVLSAVTSALMRYDDVLLNDVFPFTLIEPSLENAAMYFYNCLEDTLALMDLELKEITLWETPELWQRVSTRSVEMDGLINHGEDILEDIRGRLNGTQADKEPAVKNRRGQVFRS